MQLNALIITLNLDFEVTNSYKVKWDKSHFDSNVGISCREVIAGTLNLRVCPLGFAEKNIRRVDTVSNHRHSWKSDL